MHLQKPKRPQCAHGGGATVGGPADERHVRRGRVARRRPGSACSGRGGGEEWRGGEVRA